MISPYSLVTMWALGVWLLSENPDPTTPHGRSWLVAFVVTFAIDLLRVVSGKR